MCRNVVLYIYFYLKGNMVKAGKETSGSIGIFSLLFLLRKKEVKFT